MSEEETAPTGPSYDINGVPIWTRPGSGSGGQVQGTGLPETQYDAGREAVPAPDATAEVRQQVERLTVELESLRAQLMAQQAVVVDVLGRSDGLTRAALELARDVNVLQLEKAWEKNDQTADEDDDIPGATRETTDETPVLKEDVQVSALTVATGLKLAYKGVAAKHLLGRVYEMRDLSLEDGHDAEGWKALGGARLLPAGSSTGDVIEVPVWSVAGDCWTTVTLSGDDLLALLGWEEPAAGYLLTGNGTGHAPTFQDIGVALGTLLGSETAGTVLKLVDVPTVGLVAQWSVLATPLALTPGAGLLGSAFDTTVARTWTLDFGAGYNQVARGNHSHGGYLNFLAAELKAANQAAGAVLYDGDLTVTAGLVPPNRMGTGLGALETIWPGSIVAFGNSGPGVRCGVLTTLMHLMGSALPASGSLAVGMTLRLRSGVFNGVGPSMYYAQWEDAGAVVENGDASGQVLVWNQTAGAWQAAAPSSPVPDGGADGDILVWSATAAEWQAEAPPAAGTAVPEGSADGQMLVWNATASEWRAVTPADPAGATVPLGTETGEALVWNETAGEWEAVMPDAKEELTPGTGLLGDDYDTTEAQSWELDFGSGVNQVARGNHAHVGVYASATHDHDYKTGLELDFAGVVPSGIMVYLNTGYISALATLTPGMISSGAVGSVGRVMAFGDGAADVGALYDLPFLLGSFAPVKSGVSKAAGLYPRLTYSGGQYGVQWDSGVPDGAAAGQVPYWNVTAAGWQVWEIAGLLAEYVAAATGETKAPGLVPVLTGATGNWSVVFSSLAKQAAMTIPASGDKAIGQVLTVAGTSPNFTAQWAAAPSVGAENPGAAVVALGAWSDTADGAAPGGEAALSGAWQAGGDNGLVEYVETRQRYYNAGTKRWYAYGRKKVYDKYGRLFSVSGETRWIVEMPETP